MAAIRATPVTSPLGASPASTRAAAFGDMRTTARARAKRAVSSLPLTSTMRAWPSASRCVSAGVICLHRISRHTPDLERHADAWGMRQLPARPTPAPIGALDAVLARLSELAGSLLDHIPGTAVTVLDTDFRLRLMVGPAWAEMGIDPDVVLGLSLAEISPPTLWERVGPEYEAVLAGEPRAFSVPDVRERVLWVTAQPIVDDDGAVVGLTSISWDQTEMHRAEELYRVLAENATDAITRHDVAGNYLYVSPSMRAMTGHAPEALLGRNCFELIHPDDHARMREALARTLEEEIVTIDYRLERPDGTYGWAETAARAVRGQASEAVAEF